MTDNSQPMTDLTDRTKPITSIVDEQIERATQQYSRRSVIKTAIGIAGAGALGIYATGNATAAPSGTFPAETDDPLAKIRADRMRYIARTSAPSAPASGRVISYVDDGDLP